EVQLTDVTLTFTVPVDDPKNATLTLESEVKFASDGRKPFAYNISNEWLNWDMLKVNFSASAPAEGGEVVFFDSKGNEYVARFDAVDGGVNTITIALDNFSPAIPPTKDEEHYTWGVRLIGKTVTAPVKVSEISLPKSSTDHVGIAVIKDPESEAYGYTVIGMSGQHGYMVFDQNGMLQYGGPIHADWQAKNFASGGSSNMFGSSYMGYAVFANWNDKAAGYWAVNPLDPNEEPYNMLASPGATMLETGKTAGLWSLNGKKIGGGSMSIDFANLGDETFVVNFDEDLTEATTKHVCTRRIKTGDKYITVPYQFSVYTANNGGGVAVSDKGYFVVNSRVNDDDTGNYAVLRYFNFNNELLFTTNKTIKLTSGCNSVACNADGTMLALTEYNTKNTNIYSVTYTEPAASQAMKAAEGPARAAAISKSVPSFTKIATITTGANGANPRPDLAFDAAGNLHVADRIASKYAVYAMPGETSSFTKAPEAMSFDFATGVEDVADDVTADDAEAEYYTLQGIRVDGNNLTPGFYIRRQGNTSTKIYIK
ncbi:MAG: hypothetical protein K2L93_07010, partial [Muribaculaceae bacterium]|nr:hypothetical protein [Muribaculaceae bacterium]